MAVCVGLAVAACGGSGASGSAAASAHAASGPVAGGYPVKVAAGFPASQQLAQRTDLKIDVTNAGSRALPDVTVTLTNPMDGTGAEALSTLISDDQPAGAQPLASRSRAVWMIDREPGPCGFNCAGGAGADSSDADTWALGKLGPGRTAHFDWRVTAIRSGSYGVAYRVEAGSGTGSKAVLAGGGPATGRFNVRIAGHGSSERFTASGKIVPRVRR